MTIPTIYRRLGPEFEAVWDAACVTTTTITNDRHHHHGVHIHYLTKKTSCRTAK
jgi:hypothetical protein